jgi:hypothetical protein
MSCWVVPTIAAELWGVSIDHVLQQVRDGHLPHRVHEGFMFVDVAPHGGGCGIVKPAAMNPPTFTALSEAEIDALCDETVADIEAAETVEAHADVEDRNEEEESQSPADDEASVDLGDWRAARQRVGRTRIPPRAKPQAA